MMNKMIKKVAIAVAAMTMAIAGSAMVASANDGMGIDAVTTSAAKTNFTVSPDYGTYYVNNDIGLNVRALPSKESASLGGLYRGDAVSVTGRVYENGAYTYWVQISFNGQTAYVRDCLQTTKPAPQPAPQQTGTGVNATYTWIKETNSANTTREKAARGQMSHDNDTFTACVQSGYLALRSSAVTDPANEIAHISNGSMVQVQSYGSQFDYVYVPSLGMYGYVNNDYLA